MGAGSTEQEAKPDPEEYFAFDMRTNVVFKFRRMNKYVLLQTIPFGVFMKVGLDEFDEFFEGTPNPIDPHELRIR